MHPFLSMTVARPPLHGRAHPFIQEDTVASSTEQSSVNMHRTSIRCAGGVVALLLATGCAKAQTAIMAPKAQTVIVVPSAGHGNATFDVALAIDAQGRPCLLHASPDQQRGQTLVPFSETNAADPATAGPNAPGRGREGGGALGLTPDKCGVVLWLLPAR
jgi:hypothetical protein